MNDNNAESGESFQIGNEFALVYVRKIRTHNGERIEITSPKLGYSVQLDAIELESLTWQNKEIYSKFLEMSRGFTH